MDQQFLRVGLCGWQTSQAVYYQNFDLIEINSSFYKLPQTKTAQRWREQAPKDFMYTMKALQVITHEPYSPTYAKGGLDIPGSEWKFYGSFRPSPQVHAGWMKTLEIARILRAPAVVFQCPAQFTPTKEHISNLRAFFTSIERDNILCAWEPRGPEWSTELVHDLCRELDLFHCLDPFLGVPAFGSPRYFRLHGSPDMYRSAYGRDRLKAILQRVMAAGEVGAERWVIFDNTASGAAAADALALARMARSA